MTSNRRDFCLLLGIVALVVGIGMAYFSLKHGHRHTGINGLMIAGWGVALAMAMLVDDADYFVCFLGSMSAAVGVIMYIHAGVLHHHPHTARDGIGLIVGGVALAAISWVANNPVDVSRRVRSG
ncbi:MAG: hypothetical protein AAB449_00005 [Patescibacteria group bacterium]